MADGKAAGHGGPEPDKEIFIRSAQQTFDAEVFAVDRELRYVVFNEAHERQVRDTCGAAPAEGVVITDLVPDSGTRSRLYANLHRALEGEAHTTTGWWSCTAAPPRLVEFNFAPVRGPEGAPVGVAVMMRDGTALTEREAAFAVLERQYEAILRASADGVVVLRADGSVVECNEAFARLVGLTVEEAFLGAWTDWAPAGERDQTLAALHAFFDHHRIQETVVWRKDGSGVAVEIAGSPITIGGESVVHLTLRDITERQRTAQAVAESEDRLRVIFIHAPIGIGVADLSTGRLVEANTALLGMFGRTLAEASDRPFSEFTHPDDQETEARALADLLEHRRYEYQIRKRYVHPDGSCVPVEIHVVRLPDALGRPPLVLGIATDLRSEAESEEALRESEARYRRLSENAQDIIYRYRLGDSPALEYISSALERIFGLTPAECYADPSLLFQRIEPADQALFLSLLLPGTDITAPQVIRWRLANGTPLSFEHRSTHVRDEAGKVIAIEGIARDITNRIVREERLRLLARAVEQAVEMVVITDPTGRILEVNDAFLRTTGYEREEVIGGNPRLLKSGLQDLEFYRLMWQTLAAGKVFSGAVKNRRKDGTLYDAELNISPVRDADGTVTHYVGLQRDVTEDRSKAEQLRQAQKMEAMGEVTGGIAHDFNNLLTVILANASLLERDLVAGSPGAGLMKDLSDAAHHGAKLVRQLLAFGRRELLSPESTDLNDLLPGFLGMLQRILPENIAVIPVEGTAPPAFADPAAVEQILLNLATNARDSMPKGGTLSVELGSIVRPPQGEGSPARRFATITVRDTGSGMDTETKRRALEPFFTTKPEGKGTGLGLSMVFGIMEQLGGWVQIDSEPGHGTAIILGFALATSLPGHLTPVAPLRPADSPLPRTVLLVEDSDALLRIAKRVLERFGCRVLTAVDGERGFQEWQAHRHEIDIIITDAVMPVCDGPEMVLRIRAAGGTCPIILASGYTPGDFSKIEGEVTHLPKPWTGDQLTRALAEAHPPRPA